MTTTLWWLSFCDPDRPDDQQFLGVCVVAKEDANLLGASDDEDGGMLSAVSAARFHGCNPGGEVVGCPIPEDIAVQIEPRWRNRLLTRDEAEALDREMEVFS